MNIKPLHDRVLIEKAKEETKTPGGIIVPGKQMDKSTEGIVVAVGCGARNSAGKVIPLEIKVGDRVFFGKYAGAETKHEGKSYLIMKESEILMIVG